MLDIIKWLLVLEILGLIGLPIAFRLFAALPSRGYAFAKPLALLLIGYAFWLLASFKFLMNTTSAVVFVLLVVAGFSAYRAWRDRDALNDFWRANRTLIVASELVFLAFFALWIVYRAYNPDISSTEKPMDLLFLNSTLRAPEIPPRDPWLAGYAISYYYFGYLLNAMLVRLSGVTVTVGFSLALAGIMGLTASGAYTIVYDLITLTTDRGRQTTDRRPSPVVNRRALAFALFGALFVVLIGNFEGVLELLNAHGIGSPEFYAFFNVRNLPPTYNSPTWTPSDNWWWWRASRVLSSPNQEIIDEFPFFSFIIADLHPHVMALPFVMLAIGLALTVLSNVQSFGTAQDRRPTSNLQWLYPILLGALGFLNSWDFPTYTGLVMLAFAINRYRALGLSKEFWSELAQFALFVGGLGVALYLPFYLTFSSQASGLRLVDFFDRRTTFAQMLLFWGFFFFIVGSYLVAHGRNLPALLRQNRAWWVYGALCLFVLFVTALFQWWTAMTAALLFALGLPLLTQQIARSTAPSVASAREPAPAAMRPRPKIGLGGVRADAPTALNSAKTFALLMALIGVGLIFLVEFAFIRDSFGTRMNTVFKFYYQAWILLALASAYFVYEFATRQSPLANRSAWLAIFALLFVGTLVYPVAAFASQTNHLQGAPTLDGLDVYEQYHPGDAAAMDWLKQNAPLDSVIVEGMGSDYTNSGRVSVYTALPTVIGWVGHELQWRGSGEEAGRREQDVNTIYTSYDAKQVQTLLRQYGVDYVFVGEVERARYGNAIPLLRFNDVLEKVYDQQGTLILRVK